MVVDSGGVVVGGCLGGVCLGQSAMIVVLCLRGGRDVRGWRQGSVCVF